MSKEPVRRKRFRILSSVLFGLLVVHFVLVYVAPDYVYIGRPGSRRAAAPLFNARPGPPPAMNKVFQRNGRTYLFGGPTDRDHFDVTRFRLNPNRLRYGVGRETFPALIEPEFSSAEQVSEWLKETESVLAVKVADQIRVYPLTLLRRHEVVNDVIGGRSIFVTWCWPSGLGAVYDRVIGDHTLTFATAGYLYSEPRYWAGRDVFIFWDRETESLWWAPMGIAVSGPMLDTPLKVLEHELWAQTTWGDVYEHYPHAQVLKRQQTFEPPKVWPRIEIATASVSPDASDTVQQDTVRPSVPTESVVPHAEPLGPAPTPPASAFPPMWGDNPSFETEEGKRRAESEERRAKSEERRAKSEEQRAKSKERRAKSEGRRAKGEENLPFSGTATLRTA